MGKPTGTPISRRRFAHLTLVAAPLTYGAALVGGALLYLVRPVWGKRRLPRLKVGARESFLEGEVKRVDFNDQTVFILAADEELVVKKANCPHLACSVNWNAGADQFRCPCHGMTFRRDGTYIQGPTPKPLSDQPFEVDATGEVILLDDQEA